LSRIGKVPVQIPDGVQVSQAGSRIEVKGKMGTLHRDIPEGLKVEIADNSVQCIPLSDDKNVRALWGMFRALIANMVTGVSQGYRKQLEIVGVGYKAELKGNDLNVFAGYSGPVLFKAREGLTYKTEAANKVSVEGIDKGAVGQAAADIRAIRPPEPYKGKGIRYAGEQIRRKEGKAAGK